MKKNMLTLTLLCALCACGGSDDDSRDMSYPEISQEGITAVPTDCQVFTPGGVIPFNYIFKDDTELGSYNIEIHNNFDHHTHGTTSTDCEMDEKKTATANAWIYNQDFTIPAGTKKYASRFDIQIPSGIDTGDYHFMVRLTDKAGWTTLHAVAIKIQ